MNTTTRPPLSLTDPRRPGEPLCSLQLKLPRPALEELQEHAQRLQCFPTALGRALVLRGLEELRATAAQEVE